MVSAKKDFIGRMLARRPALTAPDSQVLVGLWPLSPAASLSAGAHLIEHGGPPGPHADLGHVTSTANSPTLGRTIGLGLLAGGAARRCREAAAGLASVVDQSDARALLRLRGPRLMDTLAKGLEIDLHPRAFPAGSVALTALSHVPVVVWKRREALVLDLLVPRPTAADIWHWLQEAAAEFGIEVERDAAGP
jgi:glycine cleavage system aminomethyltransferase T